MSRYHLTAASLVHGTDPVRLTPERAGWRYTGLNVIRLEPGGERVVDATGRELLVLPLSGGASVSVDGATFELRGRDDVFAAPSDFVYVPAGAELVVRSAGGGEFALPWARAEERYPAVRVAAEQVPVSVRGAGRASRLIRDTFIHGGPPAHRLAVVEVLTPPGNWSSYPPHKHDDPANPAEDVLEEIYWFRIAGENGWGIHRTYTADGEIDETVTVRDGDAFLVPRGYHGPCIAAPEFPMYYLNVLAGPDGARTLACSDDPAFHWIRESWKDQQPDPRTTRPLRPAVPRVHGKEDA